MAVDQSHTLSWTENGGILAPAKVATLVCYERVNCELSRHLLTACWFVNSISALYSSSKLKCGVAGTATLAYAASLIRPDV